MSDRRIQEPRLATKQAILALDRRTTRINHRAQAGAVRKATLASFDAMSALAQTVVNLELTSGRWIIHHRARCYITASATGLDITMRSRTPEMVVLRTQFIAGWNVGASVFPFSDFGDLVVVEDTTTVSLEVYGTGFDSSVWGELVLMAKPV